jgi:hypothetical protein
MANKKMSKRTFQTSVKNVLLMVLEDNVPLVEAVNKVYGRLELAECDSKKYVHINNVKEMR